jgi:Flp pilus assembly protein CpaB
MNTKKIWIISIILGLVLTVFAYLTIFSNVKTTTAVKVSQKVTKPAKTAVSKREFSNQIVDVSKGKRAISIKIALDQGVSGYIAPNSKVDVIAYESSKDDAKNKEYRSAVLVLENVKVLAAGKSADNNTEALNYQTVTLEVTAEEGVVLSLASKDKDGFYLMLRNNGDTDTGKAGFKQTREVIKEGGS